MNTSKKMKLSLIALGALSSALMSANAAAACATGKTATITLNKTILATIAGGGRPGGVTLPVADASTGQALWGGVDYGKRYIYLNAFLADSAFSYSTLSNTVPATATGGTGVVAGTTTYTTQTLPVVCATSATPNYTTTFQTGNIVSTYNAGTGTGKLVWPVCLKCAVLSKTQACLLDGENCLSKKSRANGWLRTIWSPR